MRRYFDHERLEVYRAALSFVEWQEPVLQKLPKSLSVADQLDRASTSIPLNIAEGNGKFTGPDRCRFLISPGAQRWKVRRHWTYWWPGNAALPRKLPRARIGCGASFPCWSA